MALADIIGLAGAGLIVAAYAASQLGRLDVKGVLYSGLNLVGAGAILFSLYFAFNLPAFAIEAVWLAISAVGVVKALRARRRR